MGLVEFFKRKSEAQKKSEAEVTARVVRGILDASDECFCIECKIKLIKQIFKDGEVKIELVPVGGAAVREGHLLPRGTA